jgi:urocanate hydratase
MAKRIKRALIADPRKGIIRHADARYEVAKFLEKNGVKVPNAPALVM